MDARERAFTKLWEDVLLGEAGGEFLVYDFFADDWVPVDEAYNLKWHKVNSQLLGVKEGIPAYEHMMNTAPDYLTDAEALDILSGFKAKDLKRLSSSCATAWSVPLRMSEVWLPLGRLLL